MKRAVILGGAAVIFLWIGVGGFSASMAPASSDRTEDRLNNDAPDQNQDAMSGDSSESSDASTPSNDSASSNVNAAAKVAKVGGHWSGGITDDSLGAGTLDLFIAQSGRNLNGGFDASFSGGSEDSTGSLSGKVSSSGVSGKWRPNGGGKCRIKFTGVVLTVPDEIKGTYTSAKCKLVTQGGFDVLFEHK